jgi:LysR family hydrogen peroxide-inducible transcriptional activator
MNIRDLEYLTALDKYRHFGKAARHSYVSQPTLSGQIKKLEEELGVVLIERGKRRAVVFTEAGRAILQRAKAVLEETQKIYEIAQRYKKPLAGTLKLAAIPTVGPYVLPLVHHPLREAFKDLRFVLSEMTTEQIIAALRNGDIDVGLMALPLSRDGLAELPLFEESFSLALPGEHPHAGQKQVSKSRLGDQKLLLLEEGHCFRHQALAVCNSYNTPVHQEYRGSGLETLRYMVQMGEGATLVPKLAEQSWRKTAGDTPLTFVPFTDPEPVRQVGFLFRQGSVRLECFSKVGEVIIQTVAPLLGRTNENRAIIPVE